ncbi:MAG: glyoxalase/bleomycin resistance/extradiol dioxygenase family protein [Rhodobiaceae bacterium]|nr:MAG: glyoxalase/bleomycin resistance/extradiol dioxygenase family protein [Rhodobiaceae bacterium]
MTDGAPQADTLPVLASKDFNETVSFYEKLEFETIHLDPGDGGYLILRRGPIELHFFPYPDLDPKSNYCGAYIRGESVDAIYDWLGLATHVPTKPEGIPRVMPPEDKPWRMREFHLIDPSGNLIRFGQAL